MACGGAFYMLGEVEFIIAAEHATFFDPHVTYGMTAAFEPIHMAGIMPFGEIMRLSLLGNYERMSADACVRDRHGLRGRARRRAARTARAWAAAIIASQPDARDRGHGARDLGRARDRRTARPLRLGYAYVAMGTNQESIAEGQKLFESGQAHRLEAAVERVTEASRDRRRRAVRLRAGRHQVAVRAALPGARRARSPTPASPRTTSTASARAAWACSRRSRSPSTSACGRRGSTAPASAARPGSSWSSTRPRRSWPGHVEVVVLVYGSTTRADLKARRRRANLAFGARGPVQFDAPFGHTLIAKYAMATRRHMHEFGTTIEQLAEIAVSTRYNAGLQPRRVLPRPDHDRRRAVVAR